MPANQVLTDSSVNRSQGSLPVSQRSLEAAASQRNSLDQGSSQQSLQPPNGTHMQPTCPSLLSGSTDHQVGLCRCPKSVLVNSVPVKLLVVITTLDLSTGGHWRAECHSCGHSGG